MKKKLASTVMAASILIAPFSNISNAEGNEKYDTNVSVDNNLATAELDDGYSATVEQLADGTTKAVVYDAKGNVNQIAVTNKEKGTIELTDEKGQKQVQNISEYYKEEVEENQESVNSNKPMLSSENLNDIGIFATGSYNYLYEEPMTNEGLERSAYNDGTYYLASWTDSTGKKGNLYRNAGTMTMGEAHRFTFTPGSKVGAALSLIAAYFSPPIALGIVVTILSANAGVIVDGFSGKVDYRTYVYRYTVRVNNKVVPSPSNFFRSRDYWVATRDNGQRTFTNKSFNDGWSMTNQAMIETGIRLSK
ncbi:hypothetical protein [Saccharibacillus endophyticus]|uniref:Uncharacterized protein n=1 Tax=Saccharibacillus endophyticus TaxID=2060666 RepID=A0ABQ2A714_9BACL|nr:hypothetical protein [Saccharibacillus endophyticus]GGH87336.1 hypothetical protein GCM10007362_49220 [Saccharibacillus endophyticus]